MRKILVIEDEAQTREIFLRCLTFEGYYAIGAETGLTGLKLAQVHLPDLIVCDIMMPDIDGYKVLSNLRQAPQTAAIPFIFLTAKVTMSELRQGMERGADDYLTKPCTVEQFLSTITTRLERQELFKQRFVAELKQQTSQHPLTTSPASATPIFPNCPQLATVFHFIESHYNQQISLRDVAQSIGYSPAYLTNLVQSQTGRSIKQWIIERRMVEARRLLQETSFSVTQIAETIGYPDVGYFTRLFRQLHGIPPQSWRNRESNLQPTA